MSSPQIASPDEAQKFLDAHPGVEFFEVLFSSMTGVPRGKRLRRHELLAVYENGRFLPGSVLVVDTTGQDCEDTGLVWDDGDADRVARPIPGTLTLAPWLGADVAQVALSMYELDGTPNDLDPRHVLRRVIERFEADGLVPVVACELEFYLLDPARTALGEPLPPKNPLTGQVETSKQPYSMDDLDAYATFIRRCASNAEAQGIPASAAITEYSPGQFEINLKHQPDAVAACDNAVLLKRCIKGSARELGYNASFMSKPFLNAAGSGMHVHVSLIDKAGMNLFGETGDKGEKLLRHAIGGLQATMAEGMAIFGANPNASRRYVPGANVPMSTEWGHNNRTVAFRIPAGGPKARRIEHRVAGADANPYLTMAAILAGIAYGIKNKCDPGEPASKGDFARPADPKIPFRFPAALERLAKAKILPQYIEPEALALYVDARRVELDKFHDAISPREYNWYL